jgi:hypothetical protein
MIEGLHVALLCMWDQILSHEMLKKQATVSRSSTEAEYKSLTNATTEVM